MLLYSVGVLNKWILILTVWEVLIEINAQQCMVTFQVNIVFYTNRKYMEMCENKVR